LAKIAAWLLQNETGTSVAGRAKMRNTNVIYITAGATGFDFM